MQAVRKQARELVDVAHAGSLKVVLASRGAEGTGRKALIFDYDSTQSQSLSLDLHNSSDSYTRVYRKDSLTFSSSFRLPSKSRGVKIVTASPRCIPAQQRVSLRVAKRLQPTLDWNRTRRTISGKGQSTEEETGQNTRQYRLSSSERWAKSAGTTPPSFISESFEGGIATSQELRIPSYSSEEGESAAPSAACKLLMTSEVTSTPPSKTAKPAEHKPLVVGRTKPTSSTSTRPTMDSSSALDKEIPSDVKAALNHEIAGNLKSNTASAAPAEESLAAVTNKPKKEKSTQTAKATQSSRRTSSTSLTGPHRSTGRPHSTSNSPSQCRLSVCFDYRNGRP